MKPIKVRNEFGATIEIRQDPDGRIEIRHSHVNDKFWGVLHEYTKRVSQPDVRASLKEEGIDVTTDRAKELLPKMGGYMVIRGKTNSINPSEITLIYEAIKEAGGIVPNWSSHP